MPANVLSFPYYLNQSGGWERGDNWLWASHQIRSKWHRWLACPTDSS